MIAKPSQFREAMPRIAIYWTDERFRIDGLSYPGIPMLVDRRTMRHLLVPTEWLVDLAVVDGRAQSPLTWRTYAYGLRDFLAFADDHGWDWSAPTEAMIATYSNHLAQSGRKRNTVNRAVTIICKFYEWAHARKFIRTLDLRYEAVRMTQHGFLAHIVDETKLSARAVVIPRRRRNERLPRFFTKAEQERIIEAAQSARPAHRVMGGEHGCPRTRDLRLARRAVAIGRLVCIAASRASAPHKDEGERSGRPVGPVMADRPHVSARLLLRPAKNNARIRAAW